MSTISFLPNIPGDGRLTGIGRYSINLMREILKYDKENKYYTIDMPNIYEKLGIPDINIDLSASNPLLCDKKLALKAYLLNIDLIHSFYLNLPERRTFKSILTIHDLIALKYPEWFINNNIYNYMNTYLRRSAKSADHIISVSDQTKSDIIDLFGINENKITTIYLGVDSKIGQFDVDEEINILNKYFINSDYILSVCTFEPRKNLIGVLKAYSRFREKHNDKIKLVLCGGTGWKNNNIFNEISENRFKDDIIITGYVSDKELGVLYKNAMVFMYISLYEGFGLPVLEAMAYGIPVITSNNSSLPEVGGDAVCYCDPKSLDSVLYSIEKVVLSDVYRNELKSKSTIRAKNFSYKKTAEETIEVYNKILS